MQAAQKTLRVSSPCGMIVLGKTCSLLHTRTLLWDEPSAPLCKVCRMHHCTRFSPFHPSHVFVYFVSTIPHKPYIASIT
jgi:hypothetical protein